MGLIELFKLYCMEKTQAWSQDVADNYAGGFLDAVDILLPCSVALENFAGIEANDGDDFEGVDGDVILRVEITARDLHAARTALNRMRARVGYPNPASQISKGR